MSTKEVDTTSDDVNELEAYFDDEDSDVEADTTVEAEEETEEVEQEESEEEEAPASDDTTEDTEEDEQTAETVEEESSEETEAEEEDTASEQSEEEVKPEKGKPDPKLAKEAALRREAERKLREAEQKREAETIERYLAEAEDDEMELAKRERDVNNYLLTKERSAVLADKLEVSVQKAAIDLGIKDMDDATKQFVGRRLAEFEATRVIKDQNGNIVQVNGDVYQYLTEELGSIQAFRSSGAREQTKKKAKEKAAVIPKPTRTPKEKPVDDDMAAFDEEADKW